MMIDFIRLKSYNNTNSTGEVEVIGGDDMNKLVRDGMVAVLARRMKDVHFSIMMYWFAALGLLFTSTTIFVKCLIT